MELGSHSDLDYYLLQVSTVGFRTLSVTLLRTAVQSAISEEHKLLRTGGVPTSLVLLFWQWLRVSSVFTDWSTWTSCSSLPDLPPALSPFPISLVVSGDVKHHKEEEDTCIYIYIYIYLYIYIHKQFDTYIRAQELCEIRGGRPGFPFLVVSLSSLCLSLSLSVCLSVSLSHSLSLCLCFLNGTRENNARYFRFCADLWPSVNVDEWRNVQPLLSRGLVICGMS